MESFWDQVKQQLKKDLPDHSYRMWIQPISYKGASEGEIVLACPNVYSKKRVQEYYLAGLQSEFSRIGCHNLKIKLVIQSRSEVKKPTSYAAVPIKDTRCGNPCNDHNQMLLPGLDICFDSGRMLKKSFTFDHFVVGKNSDFAYTASLSIAQGNNGCNGALYLLSDTGLGKSHLSQAVGHYVLTHGFTDKVYYVTAEDFTNEMVYSLRNNTIDRFKEKYRQKCDVLILEDIHFLSGKDATQKVLAITLDYLLDANKKIIFSGCELPDDIPKMNAQLKSRLTHGLVTRIDPPDYHTRVRILRKKAQENGYCVPRDVMDYIAQELSDNVRQLESGLAGVAARAGLLGEKIDINLASEVLSTISRNRSRITIDGIKRLVCKEYNVSENDLVSASRKKKVAKPRQVAIYLARKYTDQPLKKIGKSFNRYHATAIYSINAVEKELKLKGRFNQEMQYLSRKIESGIF